MTRLTPVLAILLASTGFAHADGADAADPAFQTDVYRDARSYASMRGTTPEACAAACAEDRQCRAWSLTPPTFRQGPRCELKTSPGTAQTRTAAVSGVLEPAPAPASAISRPRAATQSPPVKPTPAPTPGDKPAQTSTRPAAPDGLRTRTRIDPLPQQPDTAPTPQAPAPARPVTSESPAGPWPGLRKSPRPETASSGKGKPLPFRRTEGAATYSVQGIEILPGDYEDNAGLQGRLPAGHTDPPDDPEDEKTPED